MSDNLKLGSIIEPGRSAERDAVHIAVAPVIAAGELLPGQRVGIDSEGMASAHVEERIGIIDPFLREAVKPGERCWLYLFPGSITSLRHEWTHPAFPKEQATVSDSEMWLRAYAMRLKPYDTPSEAFNRLVSELKTRELFGHGTDLHGLYELDDAEELRHHAEQFLGITINWSEFSFSCSC